MSDFKSNLINNLGLTDSDCYKVNDQNFEVYSKWIPLSEFPEMIVMENAKAVHGLGGEMFLADHSEVEKYSIDRLLETAAKGLEMPIPKTKQRLCYIPEIREVDLSSLVYCFPFGEDPDGRWSRSETLERKNSLRNLLVELGSSSRYHFYEISKLRVDLRVCCESNLDSFFDDSISYSKKYYTVDSSVDKLRSAFKESRHLVFGWL